MSYIWEKKSNFLVAEVHFLEEESSSSKGLKYFWHFGVHKKGVFLEQNFQLEKSSCL